MYKMAAIINIAVETVVLSLFFPLFALLFLLVCFINGVYKMKDFYLSVQAAKLMK